MGFRTKFVDDLTALEIVPRNSPSVMIQIVADIQLIHNVADIAPTNMELNSGKCKDMIIGFLHFNASIFIPIVIGATYVEAVSFELLGVYCILPAT